MSLPGDAMIAVRDLNKAIGSQKILRVDIP